MPQTSFQQLNENSLAKTVLRISKARLAKPRTKRLIYARLRMIPYQDTHIR
jgi:hypothetical protein